MKTKQQEFQIRKFDVAYVNLWGEESEEVYNLARIMSWADGFDGCIFSRGDMLVWLASIEKPKKVHKILKAICKKATTDDISFYVE